MDMKLLKATVAHEDGLYEYDCLQIDGDLWLVPEWLDDTPDQGKSSPARALRATLLPHSWGFGNRPVLRDPIPKAVLDGTEQGQYEVVVGPHWYVETDYLKPKH